MPYKPIVKAVGGPWMAIWFGLALSVLLSGCLMMDGDKIKAVLEGLAEDDASACVEIRGGGGGGAIVPAPAIPMVGGWGSLVACRTNQPGTVIKVGTMIIEHGVYKIQVDQEELEELRELKAWVREHGVIIVPMEPPSMGDEVEWSEGSMDSS